MDKIFLLVEKTQLWLNGDPQCFLQGYFVDGNGFTNAFLIALLWAIVGGLVFYLFIGMRSVRLSNLPVWLTTLAIVGLLTWGTTSKVVVGSDAATTGFFQSASDQKAKKLSNATAEEQRQQIQNDYQSICEAMDSPLCTTNMALNGTAMVLALAFFFIGSLACKRFTTHATAVPF